MKVGDANSPSMTPIRTASPQAATGIRSADAPAFRLDVRSSGAAGPESGTEASRLAKQTRELIAESNRDAAGSHHLDVRKLLDLIA